MLFQMEAVRILYRPAEDSDDRMIAPTVANPDRMTLYGLLVMADFDVPTQFIPRRDRNETVIDFRIGNVTNDELQPVNLDQHLA